MSLLTIEGTYKDGKIELAECPEGLPEETRVLITFLPRRASGAVSTSASDDSREALRQRAFARMEAGLRLGGPPYPRREELHDRFDG
jgi:hypothetical protein